MVSDPVSGYQPDRVKFVTQTQSYKVSQNESCSSAGKIGIRKRILCFIPHCENKITFLMKLFLTFSLATMLILDFHWVKNPPVMNTSDARQVCTGQKPLFTFGIIADVQYADKNPAGNRYYRSSLEKLSDAVSVFMKDSVEFIVNLGDLIDQDYKSYKPVLDILNSSGIKTYHITGNHDYSVDHRDLNRLPVLNEPGENYYSEDRQGYRLIFINGNEISTYSSDNIAKISQATDLIETLKKEGAINAINWNGGISRTQLGWISSQLDEAAINSEKAILFCHFPIAPDNMHNMLNYKEVYDTILKHDNVIAWLSGHNHEGNHAIYKKMHFITLKGMVETDKANSFAIVEVYNNKIVIRGYGRENSIILTF